MCSRQCLFGAAQAPPWLLLSKRQRPRTRPACRPLQGSIRAEHLAPNEQQAQAFTGTLRRAFVLGAQVLHADETPLRMLDPAACKTIKTYICVHARGKHASRDPRLYTGGGSKSSRWCSCMAGAALSPVTTTRHTGRMLRTEGRTRPDTWRMRAWWRTSPAHGHAVVSRTTSAGNGSGGSVGAVKIARSRCGMSCMCDCSWREPKLQTAVALPLYSTTAASSAG